MWLFVTITDSDWFDCLRNFAPMRRTFWRPSGAESFHSLAPDEPLLFMLHNPNNFIVGEGFFSPYTVLPTSFAWTTFGEKNGAKTETEMRQRVEKYRRVQPGSPPDYHGSCILLQCAFFFQWEEWFPIPDWPRRDCPRKGILDR
jgi:putative restriction endonuclease